ncbi:hypothetical protein KPSA3_07448 [Pseudomonas syringae pv. actinidiae]|uniref:Uncharacterized protein n=1 Tax=Pseudomonas syringae pv. actinidiae TaxID=103796 RepID=A0AAN4QCC8_PSESF|nr:hypothetical protein KPSA3_07448 [Pseudomonas syringae pv. actinidiae]
MGFSHTPCLLGFSRQFLFLSFIYCFQKIKVVIGSAPVIYRGRMHNVGTMYRRSPTLARQITIPGSQLCLPSPTTAKRLERA